MEFVVLHAGEPGALFDLWLNQHENTTEFWLLLRSPCTSSSLFSLFPHSAPRASSGGQKAERRHSLDRDLVTLIKKFKLPVLALPAAPVLCTDKHSHGESSSPNQGFTPVTPSGEGGQTEPPIPATSSLLEKAQFPLGAACWKMLRQLPQQRQKAWKERSAPRLSEQSSAMVQSHFTERLKRRKGDKKSLRRQPVLLQPCTFLLKTEAGRKILSPSSPQVQDLYHLFFLSLCLQHKYSPSSGSFRSKRERELVTALNCLPPPLHQAGTRPKHRWCSTSQ